MVSATQFPGNIFRLDALIDFKVGGDIYSGTEVNLTSWGLHKQTLAYREGGMPIEGVIQTGTDADGKPVYAPLSMTLNQQQTADYWGNLAYRASENFMYDASFVKLRQVSLEYNLPAKLLAKTPSKECFAFRLLEETLRSFTGKPTTLIRNLPIQAVTARVLINSQCREPAVMVLT